MKRRAASALHAIAGAAIACMVLLSAEAGSANTAAANPPAAPASSAVKPYISPYLAPAIQQAQAAASSAPAVSPWTPRRPHATARRY